MNILHITSHLGGGVGTVIMGWLQKDKGHTHEIICLDYANDKAKAWAEKSGIRLEGNMGPYPRLWEHTIENADIVVTHYWDHPLIDELFSDPIPPCRLVFWSHKNHPVPQQVLSFPDLFLDVSPVQGHGRYIWSTGGVDRFLEIQPKPHEGFNVGYMGWVDYRKMHPNFIEMCKAINIPDVRFTIVGKNNIGGASGGRFTFTGLVDDVAPYLAEMDILGYPLRSDHFGTSEQVLGEAMAAGVVPVVMDNPAEKLIVTPTPGPYPTGIRCRYQDEYPKAVEWIYGLPEMRRRISENSRSCAKELYSLDTMIRKWDEVFEEMMEQPKTVRHTL
jgi:glycosyltransferase involved in cell wall biosynthesis